MKIEEKEALIQELKEEIKNLIINKSENENEIKKQLIITNNIKMDKIKIINEYIKINEDNEREIK